MLPCWDVLKCLLVPLSIIQEIQFRQIILLIQFVTFLLCF